MKSCSWLAALLLCVLLILEDATPAPNPGLEIIYPERLDQHRHKRDLSTERTKGSHENSASFALKAFKRNFIIDTELNKKLISPKFTLRYFKDDGSEVISKEAPENCHYQGRIRGEPGSAVILSTCNGLKGFISNDETSFHIEPHQDYKTTGAHKVYLATDDDFDPDTCGNNDDHLQDNEKPSKAEKLSGFARARRSLELVDPLYRDYVTVTQTRYDEVLIATEYELFTMMNNSTKNVTDNIVMLMNTVDLLWQPVNIRMVLAVLEIWNTGNMIPRQKSGGRHLSLFRDYMKKVLRKKFHFDQPLFIGYKGWNDSVGMAGGRICKSPCGVVRWKWKGILSSYIGAAHELGHSFGFGHLPENCTCLSPRGCFMGGYKTLWPGFSDCNMIKLQGIDDSCLYNLPTDHLNQRCGNGIVEKGEECDCGNPEECRIKDPCCMPFGCTLKPSSQCSNLQACCHQCQFASEGAICRTSANDCDLPEYCPGNTGECPADDYLQNGVPCSRDMKLIPGNVNSKAATAVKRTLSLRIKARYIRINPQFWETAGNRVYCLRTEFYGCPADQVLPTDPTPLIVHKFCVTPEATSCSLNGNSYLVFKSGYRCDKNYMEFTLDANGILRHHCSNTKVCPEKGSKLVISNSCTDENSMYERTSEKSLKHKKSGKCVRGKGGKTKENVNLVLSTNCKGDDAKIWFMNTDCMVPLGMRDPSIIPDSSITASSTIKWSSPAYARLYGNKQWCPKENGKSHYLQVDLGQIQTISAIETQGSSNSVPFMRRVTRYYVFYSSDGSHWTGYTGSADGESLNSHCYMGQCQETHNIQCQTLWGPTAKDAVKGCYAKLNTDLSGYGTCDPTTNTSCDASDVLCGQIQCDSARDKPETNYGWSYKKITLDSGEMCSAATLKHSDDLDRGMVSRGTKCGDGKMCIDSKCQVITDLDPAPTPCPFVNNKECAGRGVCTNTNVCHCKDGYDPDTNCEKAVSPRDGGYNKWSQWTACDKACDGGKRQRHRFCNNPAPAHHGKDCVGKRFEEEDCNTGDCPAGHSCRHILALAKTSINRPLHDGVYQIYPYGMTSRPVMTYCDMSRDGGGWTLLVSSYTNTWTSEGVRLRNADKPTLLDDYSILKHADAIKDNVNISGGTFEYRLEAQERGRFGGIWVAPRYYTFTATDNGQQDVKLTTKFDQWEYDVKSINRRMPWINDTWLTTSRSVNKNPFGSITQGVLQNFYPAPWMSGYQMMAKPAHIWYWIREGEWQLPYSCAEVHARGLYSVNTPPQNGIYTIKVYGQTPGKIYCDVTSHGGGWTLVATSKTHSGWTADNVKYRNPNNPSLDGDFSILGFADAIKDSDKSQDFFQYRIEADGENTYGGIWEAPLSYSFTSTSADQTGVQLIKNFNNIDRNSNLGRRMPCLGVSASVFLSSTGSSNDLSGSIIYNDASSGSPSYLPNVKPHPGVVRYWIREGTRRSCNEIKLHGVRKGRTYKDGYYMSTLLGHAQYLPIYCDMESDPGAFTLVVTSRYNSWTRDQVPARNKSRPSLNNDYSILRYADLIKSLSNNSTFKYKLEAQRRGHYGGIWTAPAKYTFIATSNNQKNVALVKKFDAWTYSFFNSLNQRMPWIANNPGTGEVALLTTSASATSKASGSIIWAGKQKFPADWIKQVDMESPGVIWYWVNEDDCDSDRQPVHGGLTEWSSWTDCDAVCAVGKQLRKRTCTNPLPRCGGNSCSQSTAEERACNYCPASPIRSANGLCVQPSSGSCDPPDGDHLIFKFDVTDPGCTASYREFVFDGRSGKLYHNCSRKIVCPEGNKPMRGKKLFLTDNCLDASAGFERIGSKYLRSIKSRLCINPKGGKVKDGVALIYYHKTCNKTILDFYKLGKTDIVSQWTKAISHRF